jgi:hypothetical protein
MTRKVEASVKPEELFFQEEELKQREQVIMYLEMIHVEESQKIKSKMIQMQKDVIKDAEQYYINAQQMPIIDTTATQQNNYISLLDNDEVMSQNGCITEEQQRLMQEYADALAQAYIQAREIPNEML